MKRDLEQEKRLEFLLEEFKADSVEYKDLEIPDDLEGKRCVLRSLMNIRMPRDIAENVLDIQNQYLRSRAEEKGIVKLNEIPVLKSKNFHSNIFSIWQGDITRLECDAIVNASNSQMLGCFVPMHTCIDNCIHTFSGIQLRAECNRQMNRMRMRFGNDYEQPTAVPMITDAYNLPSKKIIHIVGPIVQYKLTEKLEKELSDCYKNTLDICIENGLESIAFCCISTGVFRFPNKRAAEIAVKTVSDWISENEGKIKRVIFNVFKDEDKMYYEELLSD